MTKVGGQALADGVLMRTDRAWAIARGDGTVEVGSVPRNPAGRVPVVRVVVGLGVALRLAVARGLLRRGATGPGVARSRRRNGRFLRALLLVEAVAVALGSLTGSLRPPAAVAPLLVAAGWALSLLVLRLASPPALWRYHGAEHKAVAAHERGVDVRDVEAVLACPRVHDRCGTNLVVVLMVLGLPLLALPVALQIPAIVVALAVAAEVVALAASRPRSPLARGVLAGGRAVQRWVTTAEPSPDEQEVACRALLACLEAHAQAAPALAA